MDWRSPHRQFRIVRLLRPGHPCAYKDGYVQEHVAVMYELTGRKPTRGYLIHHKDENRQNNDPSNLEWMTRGEHLNMHRAENFAKKRALSLGSSGTKS